MTITVTYKVGDVECTIKADTHEAAMKALNALNGSSPAHAALPKIDPIKRVEKKPKGRPGKAEPRSHMSFPKSIVQPETKRRRTMRRQKPMCMDMAVKYYDRVIAMLYKLADAKKGIRGKDLMGPDSISFQQLSVTLWALRGYLNSVSIPTEDVYYHRKIDGSRHWFPGPRVMDAMVAIEKCHKEYQEWSGGA